MKSSRSRRRIRDALCACLGVLVIGMVHVQSALAQSDKPAPPTNLLVEDKPWDNGTQLRVTWTLSADDSEEAGNVQYRIDRQRTIEEQGKYRDDEVKKAQDSAVAAATEAALTSMGLSDWGGDLEVLTSDQLAQLRTVRAAARVSAEAAATQALDANPDDVLWVLVSIERPDAATYASGTMLFEAKELKATIDVPTGEGDDETETIDATYTFRVATLMETDEGLQQSDWALHSTSATPVGQYFDGSRGWFFIITIVFCGAVVFFILIARSGRALKIRKIGGLEAVDEAVGRATEMGRPVLFVPGIQDVNEVQTIAGITVLSRVAKTAAEYDAKVEVPTARSLVMTTARETVEAAFMAAGRPDAYNQDLIYYVTDEQFGYVAYLSGMMVREKPAACFYMGMFYAESLILAETGNSIGAIQVAGTAQPAQLPFFVAACDYTLIGEEFFAASAYLSGSPEELGSLKGQDVGKVIVAAMIVIGTGMATIGEVTGSDFFNRMVSFLKDTVLG